MVGLLSVVIIILVLILWFFVVCDKQQNKDYKQLQADYKNLKAKYEAQSFELNKFRNEEKKKYKEFARGFLTDTVFWMQKTFKYAKENKELKNKKEKE